MKTHIARPNNTKTLCGKSNYVSDGLTTIAVAAVGMTNDQIAPHPTNTADCATCLLVYSRYWGLSK